MSDELVITLARDWRQEAERQPVTELRLVVYEEIDDEGFCGHIAMSVQIGIGRFIEKRFRMNPGTFRFLVDEIAERYHAGGPK